MQALQYTLNLNKLRENVEKQNWQNIDTNLPQIPQSLYTFEPSIKYKIYYQRLLHCLSNEQQSQRAYKLTQYLLAVNTNNYYILMLRINCQKYVWKALPPQQIQKNVKKELDYTNCILQINPKEYQIWNYKKQLISNPYIKNLGINLQQIVNTEHQFLFNLMINDDQKNYHAWDYKNWLIRYHGDFQKQIKFTYSMCFFSQIKDNVKCQALWVNCYSCWSYRLNLILQLNVDKKLQYIAQDIPKVLQFLIKNADNQCAWNYLDGLLCCTDLDQTIKAEVVKTIYNDCIQTKFNQNRFAWSFILKKGQKQLKKQAIAKLLKIDSIRKLYYEYLLQIQHI